MKIITDIHPLWLVPTLALSIGLSIFYYKKNDWFSGENPWLKKTLIALRSLSLFIILALLIGLAIEMIGYRYEKPLVVTIFDNSQSIKNFGNSKKEIARLSDFNNTLKNITSDKFEAVTFTIGEKVNQSNKLTFNEQQSNLALAFDDIASRYYNRNIGAVIFASDGNFNHGLNPEYSAKQLPLCPIYTVGIGDTTPQRDCEIERLLSNEVAFLKNKFPLEVSVKSTLLKGKNTSVEVYHKNKKITQKAITINSSENYQKVNFEIDANEIGFQQYEVKVKTIQGEKSTQNNKQHFYIEVLDNRNQVLLISSAPHPDITAIKSALDKVTNLKVEVATFDTWKNKKQNYNLIIWHKPGTNFKQENSKLIEQLNKPVLYFMGAETNQQVINQLSLGISVSLGNQSDDVQAYMQKENGIIDFSDEVFNGLDYFPPVQVHYGNVGLPSSYQTLMYQRVGKIQKNDPLLFFKTNGNSKTGIFYGEGVWRWKMYEFAKTKRNEAFDEFIQKTTNYLLNKDNTSALHITLPKTFNTIEDVLLKAEFYDETQALNNKAEIQFELTNEQKQKSVFQFAQMGDYYTLSLGKLKAGKYSWSASTLYHGKRHTKKGVFYVENTPIESFDITSDFSILRRISKQSKGQFYTTKNLSSILQKIENHPDVTTMSFEEVKNHSLLDEIWILILLFVFLGTEWFLRRWFGEY
jgi:hypothetical protein